MRRTRSALLLALACACGSSKTTQDMTSMGTSDMTMPSGNGAHDMAGIVADLMTTIAGDMAMKMTGNGNIPDPGTAMAGAQPFFDDVMGMPNLQPSMATPIGQVNGATIMAWVTNNTIAANQTQYFVFKATSGGTFQLGSTGVCSGGPVLTKIDLWNVVNSAMQTPPVMEWTPAGNPDCIPGMATLVNGNTYLLGFTAGGNGGAYSA